MPYGFPPRMNACCPFCASRERHRLLWLYFKEKTNLYRTDQKVRILHFAPEEPFFNAFSHNGNMEYHACDIDPASYRFNGRIRVEKVDITDIPYSDNTFDVVLCNHVLEHIPDDMLAMSELFRVMKKDAWAILMVPIDTNRTHTYEDLSIQTPEGREEAFGQADHVRIYGQDYVERLKRVGFQVSEDAFVKSFSPMEQQHYGLLDSENIYFCRKS
jgi:SAM-dependent methyltransferase